MHFLYKNSHGCLKTKGHLEIFTLGASEEHAFSLEKFTWVLENWWSLGNSYFRGIWGTGPLHVHTGNQLQTFIQYLSGLIPISIFIYIPTYTVIKMISRFWDFEIFRFPYFEILRSPDFEILRSLRLWLTMQIHMHINIHIHTLFGKGEVMDHWRQRFLQKTIEFCKKG